MINVILSGVGGQGTVLAAKVLAVAAAFRGWKVRTAETIGMSQRGGSVVSHVRIANNGEDIHASLVTKGSANLIVSFEPGEAARVLPYLGRTGVVVTATTPIEPVSATLSVANYNVDDILHNIQLALYNGSIKNISQEHGGVQVRLIPVDDMAITDALGGNRKILNSIMLAQAVKAECLPISKEDLCQAIAACVKPDYVAMNVEAVETSMAF